MWAGITEAFNTQGCSYYMVKPKRQRQGKVLQRWRRHKVEKETRGKLHRKGERHREPRGAQQRQGKTSWQRVKVTNLQPPIAQRPSKTKQNRTRMCNSAQLLKGRN